MKNGGMVSRVMHDFSYKYIVQKIAVIQRMGENSINFEILKCL